MCLTSITKEYADNDVEGIGYKVFVISGQSIRSPIFGFQKFEYNQWYSRYLYIAFITDTITYDSGFHIFLNREDCLSYAHDMGWHFENWRANQYKIIKVKYSGVVYEGLQENLKCLVVKSIMLLDE